MSKLSEQLAELMQEDEIRQKDLAEKLNISHSNLSFYLNDKSLPTYEHFVSILQYFNCSADFLVGKSDFPNRDKKYLPVQPFGTRLRFIMNQLGESQYSFHNNCPVSWSIMHNWLKGKSLPSVDSLIKISNYFSCSIDFLLGREI